MRAHLPIALALALLPVAACDGFISDPGRAAGEPFGPGRPGGPGGPGGPDAPPPSCDTPAPGRSPLRRLTRLELDRTIADLLGDRTAPASRLLPTEAVGGFSNNADVRTVDALVAEGYLGLAEDVAARAVAASGAAALTGCTAGAAAGPCVREWIADLGARAYRRPLDAGEVDRLHAFWGDASAAWGFAPAVELVLAAMLQSPHFLYRVEPTAMGATPGAIVRVSGYETASRLSYFLWGTMPDEALFAAAAAGELDRPEGVEAEARRMLADARAGESLDRFFEEWLGLGELASLEKDEAAYPDFSPAIASAMQEETRAFVREVLAREDGSFAALLGAPFTMASPELAGYYGVPRGAGAGFARVELNPAHHAGLLTQGGLMATHARTYETNPTSRGLFVRTSLLCGEIPPPPEDVEVVPPDPDPSLTTRERLAEHRSNPACSSCHALIDPPGFAFERFDGAGRFRATEHGLPIDATGELLATDVDGAFDGAADLAAQLAASEQVSACFVRHWFRFAQGRSESTSADVCSLTGASEAFADSGGDVRELIVAMTLTDAFLYRVAEAAEGEAP